MQSTIYCQNQCMRGREVAQQFKQHSLHNISSKPIHLHFLNPGKIAAVTLQIHQNHFYCKIIKHLKRFTTQKCCGHEVERFRYYDVTQLVLTWTTSKNQTDPQPCYYQSFRCECKRTSVQSDFQIQSILLSTNNHKNMLGKIDLIIEITT